MKYIKLILISVWAILFLSACSGSGQGADNNVATDPTDDVSTGEIVNINEDMDPAGQISHIDLAITLPAGTTQSLFDYSGDVTISGSLTMKPNCVKGVNSFNCSAQLSGGTINAKQSSCSIGQGIQLWAIHIGRASELKTTYKIIGISTNEIPFNCYLPKN